jgi:hypothetical protein
MALEQIIAFALATPDEALANATVSNLHLAGSCF